MSRYTRQFGVVVALYATVSSERTRGFDQRTQGFDDRTQRIDERTQGIANEPECAQRIANKRFSPLRRASRPASALPKSRFCRSNPPPPFGLAGCGEIGYKSYIEREEAAKPWASAHRLARSGSNGKVPMVRFQYCRFRYPRTDDSIRLAGRSVSPRSSRRARLRPAPPGATPCRRRARPRRAPRPDRPARPGCSRRGAATSRRPAGP